MITDYKDCKRLHWDYRESVRDYSHVADPSALGVCECICLVKSNCNESIRGKTYL